MKLEKKYKHLPNSATHNCFGCSPINPSGLQMNFYTNDSSVFSEVTVPKHLCGWNNLIHGGVLSTILDEIMSWAAIYLLKRITLRLSLSLIREANLSTLSVGRVGLGILNSTQVACFSNPNRLKCSA